MNDVLRTFAARLPPQKALCLPALTGSADAFLALALATETGTDPMATANRVVLAVVPGLPDADRLTDDLRLLTGDTRLGVSAHQVRLLEFPPLLPGDASLLGTRLKTLAALKALDPDSPPVILAVSFPALLSPLPRAPLEGLSLAVGGSSRQSLSETVSRLATLGYRRVPLVEGEGDFSVRGGILDAWSPGDELPVRAEFFGEDLESLRSFDPGTQLSIERLTNVALLPAADPATSSEPSDDATARTLLDYLPDGTTVLALDHNDYSLPPLPARFGRAVYTGDPAPRGVPTADFPTAPLPGFSELGADQAHHPELFDAARQRLERHLATAEKRGDRVLKIDALAGGFELDGLLVVTKADRVFTRPKSHAHARTAAGRGERLADFEDLEPGEYVVHVDYGVGRYIGSSEIVLDGKRSEVFTIEYADGGKLHVPAAHAHLLSRYVGVKGEAVRLHRLDGKRWEKDKRDAQKAVTDLAAALLETQARRETVPGFAYDVHCDGREAFDAAFPYEETPDQIAAIAAIESDLAQRKPMDRLICGDAGYGKTEVAMRAAFIAAMNGKQVAVLAPTTVLAEQHFETFTSRFDGTPIRIESVSRFQTDGTHAGTFKRLASGACDIVIGTHALLSGKIAFHDLGLIIIDEEQRFGVRHKEFLKSLRATADVLTLSATPIPRTLYLSMTGARDLSLLRTPPRERVAVETRIVRDADETIRTAIETELRRGGQVFFLHNRVSDIGKVEKRLEALFKGEGQGARSRSTADVSSSVQPSTFNLQPDARRPPRIVVAHGQMDTRTLAMKMRDFERGKYDILLSTTIVESGIDIPRANTILVDRADMFGMADLYQLRGRVGRSSRQGYAYFLLPPSGDVDSDARERLNALKRHGGLGSGFNLAVRDLELRGAGNLLGSQQSGHIAAVGFGLYCQLLQRTVARMKGEKVREIVDVKLNLDFVNPRLPYGYIEEEVQRLNLLKRFAEAQDDRTVRALAREMADRFGPLPDEAKEFVRIAGLRVACARARIDHLDVCGTRAVFYRVGSREIAHVAELRGRNPAAKLRELQKQINTLKSTP